MASRKSVTIRDVARDVGVSRQTISRVINNGPNVKPEVREKVAEAIDRLGYVPNLSARRMRGARSYLILAINDRQRVRPLLGLRKKRLDQTQRRAPHNA